MFKSGQRDGGDYFAPQLIAAYNRTGATRKQGEIAMLDILGTQAETTSIIPGNAASVFNNMTPVATAGLQSFPMAVAMADIADNAKGQWALFHPYLDVALVDDDVAAADINRGETITVGNTFVYGQKQAAGERCCGIALEDGAATGGALASGDATLKKCIWNGIGLGVGAAT